TGAAHAAGSVKSYVIDESWRRGIRVSRAGLALAPAVAQVPLTLTLVPVRRAHHLDHPLRSRASRDVARAAPRGDGAGGGPAGAGEALPVGRASMPMVGERLGRPRLRPFPQRDRGGRAGWARVPSAGPPPFQPGEPPVAKGICPQRRRTPLKRGRATA